MDPNRTLVDKFVLHHSVTPQWSEKSKAELAQWFSDNGYARAYGSNPANWSGLINPYTGARSYSQAHLAGQIVTSATPDATAAERAAGYRLVPLVKDIWSVTTWHAANWAVNCGSIGVENLGDYRNYPLSEAACRVLADFWRPRDRELGGATAIYGHLEVSQQGTECPARIMEQRNHIVDLVNTDPTPPAPVTKPVDAPKALPAVLHFTAKLDKVEVWDLTTNPNYKSVKTLVKGEAFDAAGYIDFNGTRYYVTAYSLGKGLKTAVNQNDLTEVKQPVITTKTVTRTEKIDYGVTRTDDNTIPKGEERVVKVGIPGEKVITTTITYTDGVETKREDTQSEVTKQPINQEIHVGTYVTPTQPSRDDEQDAKINGIMALFAAIGEAIKAFLDKFKK